MCRWFAYISPEEPTLLADVLLSPANAITKQCSEHYLPYLLPHGQEKELDDAPDALLRMRNSLLNMDGLGIAWYTTSASAYTVSKDGMRPALYKSQSPPTNDFNFRSLCENTESNCLFAHIRATSGSVVAPVNSHPFVFGRHAFMHNGVISDFTRIRREMSGLLEYDAYENVKGSTDSEHAAALYMTNLCGRPADKTAWEKSYPLDQMREALQKTVVTILELQQKTLGDKKNPNSLNFCATDGHSLVACRFRNHETQQPPSLYWSEFAGRTLNRKFPGDPNSMGKNTDQPTVAGDDTRIGKHTIVSSEPTTFDEAEWHLVSKNHILTVDDTGVEKEVELVYDPSLNAKQ